MPHIELNKLYSNMQEEMLVKLKVVTHALTHPGTKGDDTESNWKEWFDNYLPKRYKVDKGVIIDSNGDESDQIDIIIYDKQYSYLVFHHDNTLLIPAESVYAVFEVKPNLNKNNIEYANKKIESVRKLYRTSAPIKHAGGEYEPKVLHEIVGGLLTTGCDWTHPAVDNVAKYIHGSSKEERLDLVCSVDEGAYVVDNNTFVTEYNENVIPKIKFCDGEGSLMFFLLNVLQKLQNIGTVPAIDFSEYSKSINQKYYKET